MAAANFGISENAIELITADRGPHYEPFGWHHWPEHPWLSYQFRRGLGETQEGGGSENMRCPFLVLHGGHDVLTATAARNTYDDAKAHGVEATLRVLDPDETGAEHCQHDNPTIGQGVLADWLADRFGIDQRALLKTSVNSLI
jgi:acetyl esterase/lipase